MLVQEIEIFNSFQFFGKNIIETLIQFDINLTREGHFTSFFRRSENRSGKHA